MRVHSIISSTRSVACTYVLTIHSREALRAELISSGVLGSDAYVVIAGPANTYAHYVATREEYGVQRYEGASTIFGQCELSVVTFCYSFHQFLTLVPIHRYARSVHRQIQ